MAKAVTTKPPLNINTSWMVQGALCWIDLDPPMNASSNSTVFDLGTVVSYDERELNVTVRSHATQANLKYKPHLILERADPPKTPYYNGFEDMVNMETLNDAELLNNIMVRFQQDLIFTYVGPTLLVVNPFKGIKGMFEPEVRTKYAQHIIGAKGNPLAYKDLEPHVYAVAAEAYRSLFDNQKNQAIVISGESGAGKTENAKFCMNLLTSIGSFQTALNTEKKSNKMVQLATQMMINSGRDQSTIEEKILGCNPILEAFGNAKTMRNNNSSRFGKYVRIVVTQVTQKIKGAEIVNYLLEKSRITHPGLNERNFHMFYIFLSGMSVQELDAYQMTHEGAKIPMDQFDYLKSSQCYTVQGIDDVALFKEIQVSIQVLGLQPHYEDMFSIVAAILLLGNVKFDDSTYGNDSSCSIVDEVAFARLAVLIKLTPDELKQALTLKQVTVQKQVIQSPLPGDECRAQRDSLAKELYDRLFNWIVRTLNKTIASSYVEGLSYVKVGLLDIYGFEVFEKNGFEQMMINYTNEKLHQLYIGYVFKEEERIFIKEGIQEHCNQIAFHDNAAVIELLDKPPTGIFKLLDESCTVKSTDESLLQKIRTCHKGNKLLQNPKMPSNPTFIVAHTAKDVEYSIQGFRDKNKDEMPTITQQTLAKSQNNLIRVLFTQPPGEEGKKGDKFLATKIKKEMVELMNELTSCDVHFVRCIKPNEEKAYNLISQNMTLNQIRYLGVLDSLKVRKESYPIRRNYQAFYKRYGDITRNHAYPILIKQDANFRDLVMEMFPIYFPSMTIQQVLMGQSRIFIKQDAMNEIERLFKIELEVKTIQARRIQRCWKVHKINKALKKMHAIAELLRTQAKHVKLRYLQKKQMVSVVRIEIWWAYVLKKRRAKKYKDSSKIFQLHIKRYAQIVKVARQKKAIEIIQRFSRAHAQKRHHKAKLAVLNLIHATIDSAWLVIQHHAATHIQKVWRGYRCRKHNQKLIGEIKDAWRQKRILKHLITLQRAIRVCLLKKRLKMRHKAAYLIQGYVRMRWLSALFQRIRWAVVRIQNSARTFMARRRAQKEKYAQYILPWEVEMNNIRQQETNSLWQSRNDITPLSNYFTGDTSQQYSSKYNSNNNNNNNTSTYSTQANDDFVNLSILDQCLLTWKPKLPKMSLFMFPIDLDILSDLNLSYNPNYSYSRTLLNILVQQLRKDHPIQTIHVTEQSTVCITVGGGSIYEFGENKLIGRDSDLLVSHDEDIQDGVEKITLPDTIRVRAVSSGNQHLLVVTHDGTLLQYGSPTEVWAGLDYRPYVHAQQVQSCVATTNASFMVSAPHSRLFTWPIFSEEYCSLLPVDVRMPQKVKCVSTGSQFAVMLCDNGVLFSWGENVEGELGLGDCGVRTQPTLVVSLKQDKVIMLSCGLKHVAVKTSLNKLYVWGWGGQGQLGNVDFQNELLPRHIQLPTRQAIIWVYCGRTSTLVITESKQIHWCGTNSMLKYQSVFQPFKIETRSLVLNQSHYVPVRVLSTFSKTMEITYVTFANTATFLEDKHNKKTKILNKLIQVWSESSDPSSVDPPFNQSLSNHIYEVSMRKPGIPFNRAYINQFFKLSQMKQQEESDVAWEKTKNQMENMLQSRFNTLREEPTTTKNNNLYSRFSSLNEQDELQMSEQDDAEPVDRVKKLLVIKRRLFELQDMPQEQWTEDDLDFIQTIYQSKVGQLLQSL